LSEFFTFFEAAPPVFYNHSVVLSLSAFDCMQRPWDGGGTVGKLYD